MKQLAWHHFQGFVPDDWEPTAYSVEDRQGRLEFANRDGFQATIGWQKCRREPDAETMMLEFMKQNLPGASSMHSVREKDLMMHKVGMFLAGSHGVEYPAQAYAFLPETNTLLRWIFRCAEPGFLSDIVYPVLASMQPNNGAWIRYALYGLNITLPREYTIEDIDIAPANIVMGFESERKARAVFRRWGLPELMTGGESLGSFYHKVLSVSGCIVTGIHDETIRQWDGVRLRFKRRPEHRMDKRLGKLWDNGVALVWLNRDENRVYGFEQVGPSHVEQLALDAVFAVR